jgi:glucan-binding YG repeat protein
MSNAAEETQYELEVGDAVETEVEVDSADIADVSQEPEQKQEDELENYSESVQKRINRLTKKMRDAEREREEAIRYAQNVQSESEQIRHRMQNLDQGYMTEYGTRLSLQQAQVEANLKRAVELGDADATVAAQKELSQLAVASNNYAQAQRQAEQYSQQAAQYYQQQVQQQETQQTQSQPQKPDAKAEQWAGKNSWFGTDEAMTFAAFGIHKKLIEDEGFDPKSDDYYNELDSRIKREFPHKFEADSSASRRPAQTVAGVSRSSSSGRNGKRVKLSPTQVAIAKKLGVPLEEYAKYVKE